MPPEEIKKKEDEKAKKAQEEAEESMTIPKRKGVKIFLYGHNFVKSEVTHFNVSCIIELKSQVFACWNRCVQRSERQL